MVPSRASGTRGVRRSSSVPDEGREIIERPPYLLVLGAARGKTVVLIVVVPVDI